MNTAPKPTVPASRATAKAGAALQRNAADLLQEVLQDLSPSARADVEGMPRNGGTLEVVTSTDLMAAPRVFVRFVPADPGIAPREFASIYMPEV